jgi:hypothetical protein
VCRNAIVSRPIERADRPRPTDKETPVTSLTTTTFVPAIAALLIAAAMPAHAQTCNSVCNQLRRACNHSAKGMLKATYIGCDETRDTCRADCEASATTCPSACETAHTDCLDAGSSSDVCDALRTECLDDCASCEADCAVDRGTCRDDAAVARDAYRADCTDSRSQCRDTCVDPLDNSCVHGCTKHEHGCRGDAKGVEVACKKECPNDGGRKSCVRSCRRKGNLDARGCEDLAVVCYAGCAGVELTTPTLP